MPKIDKIVKAPTIKVGNRILLDIPSYIKLNATVDFDAGNKTITVGDGPPWHFTEFGAGIYCGKIPAEIDIYFQITRMTVNPTT